MREVIEEEENIIPEWLFDKKSRFLFKDSFCPKDEEIFKTFLKKFNGYTDEKYQFKVIWETRNIRSLFSLVSCAVYEGVCTCGKSYIG